MVLVESTLFFARFICTNIKTIYELITVLHLNIEHIVVDYSEFFSP